jgi:hypothetical protein
LPFIWIGKYITAITIVVTANAFFVPFTATTDASEGEFRDAFTVPTILSYWLYTLRFEDIVGNCMICAPIVLRSVGSGILVVLVFVISSKYGRFFYIALVVLWSAAAKH